MDIYFVDEDAPFFESWILELRGRGYIVHQVPNADIAYHALREAVPPFLAIIDVSLSPSHDADTRYPESRTDDNLETGLILLEDLIEANSASFPGRSVLLTNTDNPHTYDKALEFAGGHAIRLLEKDVYFTSDDFADEVEDVIREIDALDREGSL